MFKVNLKLFSFPSIYTHVLSAGMVLLRTYNICFDREIRKIISNTHYYLEAWPGELYIEERIELEMYIDYCTSRVNVTPVFLPFIP